MKEAEEVRKSDPLLVLVGLILTYFLGKEMSALINSSDSLSGALAVVLGFFTILILLFFAALIMGGIERICNSLFKVNEICDEQERKETVRKISNISAYGAFIPSIFLFIFGWIVFDGDMYDFLDSFGAVGEYLKIPGMLFILAGFLLALVVIHFIKKSSESSSANNAKAAISYILATIICIGAVVAVYNANERQGDFSNRYGTATTTCAINGCDNYIASSGDTNCCERHSGECLECGDYIDSDAMFCMDCLRNAYE